MLLLLPSERINGSGGRRYDRCWEFRPRELGLRLSEGEERERDESGGCWERDVMLVRKQRSMVARGSMGIMVGINTGCRRHLRRRWWGNGDAEERERGWDNGLRKLEGHWTFSLDLRLHRTFEFYLLWVPFLPWCLFFPIVIVII